MAASGRLDKAMFATMWLTIMILTMVGNGVQSSKQAAHYYKNRAYRLDETKATGLTNVGDEGTSGSSVCPPGWMGADCKKFYCEDFCLNDGRCIGNNTCECPVAYARMLSKNCKKSMCTDDCGAHGFCEINIMDIKTANWMCQCDPGYAGKTCNVAEEKNMTSDPGVCKEAIDAILQHTGLPADLIDVPMTDQEIRYCRRFVASLSYHCDMPMRNHSQENCATFCPMSACKQIYDRSVPCRLEQMWTYDQGIQQCKQYSYRGCQGNKNRYPSQSKCLHKHDTVMNLLMTTAILQQTGNTCTLQGKMHYTTFDGLSYNLLAGCSYKMVHDGVHVDRLEVIVNNDKKMGHSWKMSRTVNITTGNVEVYLGSLRTNGKFNVRVNDKLIDLPHDGVPKIKEVGRYVMVVTTENVVIVFDGSHYIQIKVPAEYQNVHDTNHRLSGLCGNLDGDPSNDMMDYQRKTAYNDVNEFAAVYNADSTCLEDMEMNNLIYKPTGIDMFNRAESMCSVIMLDSFSACHPVIDPEEYKILCMQDVALCNFEMFDDCMCNALSSYSQACHKKGVTLAWRKPDFCPITCSSGMAYSECATACPKSCKHMLNTGSCKQDCVDGCVCPEGLYWDSIPGKCVPVSVCSCYRDDVYYPHGSFRLGKCEKCQCNGGLWSCKDEPCSATCDVYGDPHIKTFDGRFYDMYGKCSYVLFDHCHYGDGKKELEVVMQSDNCHEKTLYTPCRRKIFINLADNTVIYMGTKSLASGKMVPTVTIEGAEVRHKSTHVYQIDSIGQEGVVFMMKEKELKLHWTGHNVYITIGSGYQNQTCGLCGTYNYNKGDDFHTRSDATETNAVAFAQSWIYRSADVNENVAECHLAWDGGEKPCDIFSTKIAYAEDKCGLLTQSSGPFFKCHHIIPPLPYYQTCKQDTCKCDNCYCDVMSAYAKICMDSGVALTNWREETEHCKIGCRTPRIMKQCNHDSSFNPVCSSCYDLAVTGNSTCAERGCIEGCYCPEGLYEDENMACVTKAKCGCYHEGRMYRSGEVRREDCNNCTCDGGSFKCTEVDCDSFCQQQGRVYSDCGRTCSNFALQQQDIHCEAGCFCAGGLVLHENGTCVEPETECQCKEFNRYFDKGQSSPSDCSKVCNGDRNWVTVPGRSAKPQYDCSATGQMQYRTFDGKMFSFEGGKCEYVLMSDCRHDKNSNTCDLNNANFNVKVKNTRCLNSYEAIICKHVSIDMRVPDGRMASIEILQQEVKVTLGPYTVTFSKGTYPQPKTAVIEGLEVFKVDIISS